MYAKISWTDERDTEFPVSFYVRGCSVTDGSNSFNVFENDCPQAIINAGFSGDAVSTTEVKLFWESFSFSEESGQHTQTVECNVQFCITEQCAPNKCNDTEIIGTFWQDHLDSKKKPACLSLSILTNKKDISTVVKFYENISYMLMF